MMRAYKANKFAPTARATIMVHAKDNQAILIDGVVKTSIYCVVCPVAILDILHVQSRPATEHYSSESTLYLFLMTEIQE